MKCLSSWILAANVAAAFIAINGRGAAGAGTEEQVFPRDSLNNGTSGDGDTKVLEDLRARYHLPALAVGVSRAGNFTGKVVGVRKQGEPVPVQLTDQFHLGSNTKAMTATLAGMFIEQNRGFRWNTTLPEALPHLARNMSDGHRNTTIAMLTSHRSGIIDDWINDTVFANSLRDPTLAPSQARLLWINRILSKAPAAKTGTFHYDNTNCKSQPPHIAFTSNLYNNNRHHRRRHHRALRRRQRFVGVPNNSPPLPAPKHDLRFRHTHAILSNLNRQPLGPHLPPHQRLRKSSHPRRWPLHPTRQPTRTRSRRHSPLLHVLVRQFSATTPRRFPQSAQRSEPQR